VVDIPDHLLMRSAEARAKVRGVPVEQVLAEWKGEAPPPPAEEEPPPSPGGGEGQAEPAAVDKPLAEPAPEEQESQVEPAAVDEAPPAEPEAEEEKVPAAVGAPAAEAAPPPPAQGPTSVAPQKQPPTAFPEGVRSHRLLTVVKSRAIQQVKAEPIDRVSVWPHLVAAEFTALLAVTAFLTILSVVLQAPLLELANFNLTPNPSKAPWYFLGLQELLSYFDPQIAGVLIPGLGLLALMAIPYIDRNPSTRPTDRKFAIMLFTFFLMAAGTLTIFGVLFRGPGFNFTYPWSDGIWFDDLLSWFRETSWFAEQGR
jgi:menaquinol-cytochrome c reductase cytochrome b/c subunit